MCALIHHPQAILHTPTGCPPWYNPGKKGEVTTSLSTSSLECCSWRNWTREESPFPGLCPGIMSHNNVLRCKPGSCLAISNVLCKPSPLLHQQDYHLICHQHNTTRFILSFCPQIWVQCKSPSTSQIQPSHFRGYNQLFLLHSNFLQGGLCFLWF